MFKKKIVTMVAAALLFGGVSSTPVEAAAGNDMRMIPVIVNGHKVKFPDTEPYINTDGRTMVPVRFVSEMLGAEVKWNANTETVNIKYEGKEIRMPIGSSEVTVDGEASTLDTAAELYEGRTMVPLRFVSEVLSSKVTWDDGAHAVQVTDSKYQAKVDAGEVTLDPWGREYSKTWDANWMKLSDLGDNFYKGAITGKTNNRTYVGQTRDWNFKQYTDEWAEHIRQYYAAQLNIDYRTINEKQFADILLANMTGMGDYQEYSYRKTIKEYVAWVKENKVIARGYADPEVSQVREAGFIYMRTHFKFMIISADDTAQTFMDNWKVTSGSDSFKLKKNLWYDGYSEVRLWTNYGNYKWKHYALADTENMFMKGSYTYEALN